MSIPSPTDDSRLLQRITELEEEIAELKAHLVNVNRVVGAMVRENGGQLAVKHDQVLAISPRWDGLKIRFDALSMSHVIELAGLIVRGPESQDRAVTPVVRTD